MNQELMVKEKKKEAKLYWSKKIISELVDEVVNELFLPTTVGFKLYPYQIAPFKRLLYSILNNLGEEIIMLFSRQSGKSETIACVSMFLMVIYSLITGSPIKIGIFAPKYEQSQIIYGRLRDRFNIKVMKYLEVNATVSNGTTVKLNDGSLAVSMTASEGSTIEGSTFDLIIVDEAQDVGDRKLLKSIFPMGAATNATRVLIGTASYKKCYFYDVTQRYVGKDNCFLIDHEVAEMYNPKYKKYIESEKERIGENHDDFRTQYKLQWILERAQFITYGILEDCTEDYAPVSKQKTGELIAGIDVAKSPDSTVLTIIERIQVKTKENKIVHKSKIIAWLELQGDDYETQGEVIKDFVMRYNIKKIVVDTVGVGDPVKDKLCKSLPKNILIDGHKWSAKSHDYIFKLLLAEFQKGRIVIPSKQTLEQRRFIDQFINLEKKYSGYLMSVHHPAKGGHHDDYCSSLALAVYGAIGKGSQPAALGRMNKLRGEEEARYLRNIESIGVTSQQALEDFWREESG